MIKIDTTIIFDGDSLGYLQVEDMMKKINLTTDSRFRCKASCWQLAEPDCDDIERLKEMREQ